jgi:hypothetical protein
VDTHAIDILSAVLAPQAQLAKGKVSDRSIVGAFYIHRHFIVKWYTSSERGAAYFSVQSSYLATTPNLALKSGTPRGINLGGGDAR